MYSNFCIKHVLILGFLMLLIAQLLKMEDGSKTCRTKPDEQQNLLSKTCWEAKPVEQNLISSKTY